MAPWTCGVTHDAVCSEISTLPLAKLVGTGVERRDSECASQLQGVLSEETGHKPVTLPLQVQCVHRFVSHEPQPVPVTPVVYIPWFSPYLCSTLTITTPHPHCNTLQNCNNTVCLRSIVSCLTPHGYGACSYGKVWPGLTYTKPMENPSWWVIYWGPLGGCVSVVAHIVTHCQCKLLGMSHG